MEGVFLGNPKDSGREDWGTLGNIRGITTPPLKTPITSAIPSHSHLSAHRATQASAAWRLGEIHANAWPKHVRVWPPVAPATGPKPSWCWRCPGLVDFFFWFGRPRVELVIPWGSKDHYFSRDLQSTIPGDYFFNGLWLTGDIYRDRYG